MESFEKGVVFFVTANGENASYNATYYGNTDDTSEIEKLNLIISHKDELLNHKELMLQHKDEMITQKDQELQSLRGVIALLQRQS